MINGIQLDIPSKMKVERKRYLIKDLIGDNYLSQKFTDLKPNTLVPINGRYGRVTSIKDGYVNVKFTGDTILFKGLGALRTFRGKDWMLRPEKAPSDRARCRECKRKIPKGAVRYYYGFKLRFWRAMHLCLPCALMMVDEEYKKFMGQVRAMRRRLGPYKELLKETRRIEKGLGVDTKEDKPHPWLPEGHRSKGDKYLE